jgi:hypothetical protein
MIRKLLLVAGALCCAGAIKAQQTQIKGFFNVNAHYNSDTMHGEYDRASFVLGQYDLFITSQITDHISMLGESVFEYDGDFGVDVERLFIKYTHDNHFAVSAGKFHTPIGYWNNAFHHGLVIQPLIVRPDVLKFEDDGGILPIHETGVQFDAEHFTKANIGLNVLISNGIGSTPISDNNVAKAITLNLHAEPVDNLVLTLSGYMNHADAGFVNPQMIMVNHDVNTTILNASVAYMNGKLPIEFIAEYYTINHDMDTTGQHNKVTNAFLLYGGYKIKRFTVYASYENITYPDDIQYYMPNNTSNMIFGLRYKPSPLAAIKVQYRNYTTKTATVVDDFRTGIQNIFEVQFAIGF